MMDRSLADHGYEVFFCPGPKKLAGGCRLVEQRHCPLVESVDVILNSLNLDESDNRAVLAALRTSYPRTPVIALVSHREGREHPSCLHGCTVEYFPTSIHDLYGLLDGLVSS
jgi:CheY-like chemotaxis protein